MRLYKKVYNKYISYTEMIKSSGNIESKVTHNIGYINKYEEIRNRVTNNE